MTTGKTIAWSIQSFVGKVMSLLFNMLSRFVIAFLPRSQVSFNFMTAVTICNDFEAKKIKSVTVSTVSPSICHEEMGPDAIILVFWMMSFKPTFSLSSFTFTKRQVLQFLFTFYHKDGVICISEVIDISPRNLDSSLYFIQTGISHNVLSSHLPLS